MCVCVCVCARARVLCVILNVCVCVWARARVCAFVRLCVRACDSEPDSESESEPESPSALSPWLSGWPRPARGRGRDLGQASLAESVSLAESDPDPASPWLCRLPPRSYPLCTGRDHAVTPIQTRTRGTARPPADPAAAA